MKIFLLILVFLYSITGGRNVSANPVLTGQEVDSLIVNFSKILNQTYFDNEASIKIESILTDKLHSGEFYNKSAHYLTSLLTRLLRDVTNDVHFYVGVAKPESEKPAVQPKRNTNGGFTEVKLLENNIGYIKWNEFIANDHSFRKLIAALEFLEGCDHLIFDISSNPGGDGRIGGFVNHHIYQDNNYQELLLKKCTGEENWKQSEVPYNYSDGPKFFDVPVYIIVSGNTASAAEYFAFTASEMERAVIMGEPTAGAGNPVVMVSFGQYFAYIPVCRIISATGNSIEGKGVIPEVLLTSGNWVEETVNYITSSKTDTH